jgi:anti-sigma factor RsiW
VKCEDCRAELTAYLDGELEGDRGGALRGHLRSCGDCRAISDAESALRDGLRALPPLDPPPSMWAGVQAQLAAAEAGDAEKPRWRRTLARWLPSVPRYAFGGLAVAAIAVLVWSRLRTHEPDEVAVVTPPPTPVEVVTAPPVASDEDATAALAAEPAKIADDYRQAVDELLAQAPEIAKEWTEAQRQAFATKVAALRGQAETAEVGKPSRRAWEAFVYYLEGALIRNDVALAGGGR